MIKSFQIMTTLANRDCRIHQLLIRKEVRALPKSILDMTQRHPLVPGVLGNVETLFIITSPRSTLSQRANSY